MKDKPKDFDKLIDKYIKANLMEEEGEDFRRSVARMAWQDALKLIGFGVEDDEYQLEQLIEESPVDGVIIIREGKKLPDGRYKTTRRVVKIESYSAWLSFLRLGKPVKLPYIRECAFEDDGVDAAFLWLVNDFISRARIAAKDYYIEINKIIDEVCLVNNLYDLKKWVIANIKKYNESYSNEAMAFYRMALFPTEVLIAD